LSAWFCADSRQQLPGLSLALMALLLALAVNVGVGTMVQSFSTTFVRWLDGRLAADVYVSAANETQAAEIRRWLAARSDVAAVLPGARTDVQIDGAPVEIMGLPDHATYRENWPLLRSVSSDWDRLHAGDAAFISEQLSRRLHLDVGGRLRIPTPGGEWSVAVVGVYADYGNPKGQLAINIDAMLRHFPDTPQTRFGLRVAPAHIAGVIAAITFAMCSGATRRPKRVCGVSGKCRSSASMLTASCPFGLP
jgi:putative ABC transport system permease protein